MNFPVVFTCINDNKEIFISVCCQNNEKGCKWLLGKTNGVSIIRMLKDEITIRQLLLECSSEKISVDYVENSYIVAYNNSDWNENSPYLPKEDSYMYAEDGEYKEEINYFSLMDDHMHYNPEYYKCVAEALGTINKGIELFAEACTIGNFLISSEVVSIVKLHGDLSTNFVSNIENYMDQAKYKLLFNDTLSILSENLSIKVKSDDKHSLDAA